MKKVLLAIFILVVFTGCSVKPNYSDAFIMNTYITQQVYGENSKNAIEQVNNRLTEIEDRLSLYKPNSDIDKINKNAGISPVKVDRLTYEIVKTAKKYCSEVDGLFDITIAPLTTLWGISGADPKVPSKNDIENAVLLVDYKNIVLDDKNKTVMLSKKGMMIDLGGIAKGYICNEIQEIYMENNVESALVSIGGNVVALGNKPNGDKFTVGIRDPLGSANEMVGKLVIEDEIVATTGAYERFFVQDAITYHHILDTKTGFPANSDLLSVTIVSENGGLADFLSTTLFIKGTQAVETYLNHDKFNVIVVDKQKNIYISDNLKDSFTLTNTNYSIKK